jgi:hypothetical protein
MERIAFSANNPKKVSTNNHDKKTYFKINSTNPQSQDVQISASSSNIYVSWWERNATSNEPTLRISTASRKTFGQMIMLSAK